jgi:dolichol kinase
MYSKMTGKTIRHLYHALGGSVLPGLALLLARHELLIVLGALTALSLLIDGMRLLVPPVNQFLVHLCSGASNSFKRAEVVRPTGATYLLVGATFVFIVFPHDVAVAALFFTAWGDAMAAMVGERFGRTHIWGKSLEGSLAFLAVSLVIGGALLASGLNVTWAMVITGAIVATIVELAPIPGNDNLSVPVLSAAAMVLISRAF